MSDKKQDSGLSNDLKNAAVNMDGSPEDPGMVSGGGGSSGGNSGNTVTRMLVGMKNALLAAPGALVRGIRNGVQGFGKSFTSSTGTFFNKAGDFLHVSPKAVAGMTVGAVVLAGAGGAVAISNSYYHKQMLREEVVIKDDCAEDVKKKQTLLSGDPVDPAAQKEENALKLWSVAKAAGLSDYQAAGWIGCMERECDLDPTSIETIYDEPFFMGPKKTAAAGGLDITVDPDVYCEFTATTMMDAYIHSGWNVPAATAVCGKTCHSGSGGGMGLATSFYCNEGQGHFFAGMGLAQYTGPEGEYFMEFCSANNLAWYEMDTQLVFIFSDGDRGGYGGGPLHDGWLYELWQDPGNTDQAAWDCLAKFEGMGYSFTYSLEDRQQNAKKWYDKFHGTDGDVDFGNSILELAASIQGGGAGKAAKKAEEECEEDEGNQYNNEDLARAAVAYAYETVDEGRGNDGTELYQFVHDNVYPGDVWYQSCDRGVACAVRWAGADDNFPAGDTSVIDSYFDEHSEKWQFVANFDEMAGTVNAGGTGEKDMQPGDIFIRPNTSSRVGHTLMYVSYEICAEKYPDIDSNAAYVSASFKTRSPGCELENGQHVGANYRIFRLIEYDENSQYKDIAAGFSGSDR